MAGRISVECPGCLAKVALPDESKLGKKVKCPKCSDVFVAEAPEDEESDEIEDEAPARSKGGKRPAAAAAGGRAKGGRTKKGPSKGGGGSNGPVIAIGAGAIVIVAVLGLWLSGVFSSPPVAAPPVAQPQPVAAAPVVAHTPAPPAPPAISPAEKILGLRWMPADTEMVVHAKVADIWQSPLLKDLVNSPSAAPGIQQLQTEFGIAPADVESVTFGVDSKAIQDVTARAMAGMAGGQPNAVFIVRTKKPLSLDHILANGKGIKSLEYKSKKYLEDPSSHSAIWLPDSSTLIMAQPEALQGIMDRGETTVPRKELMFADPNPQVVIIAAPKNPREQFQLMKLDALPPELASLKTAVQESLQAVSVGLSIRGGIDIQFATMMKDSQGAGVIKTNVESGLAEARKAFEAFKASAPPLFAELGEQLLNNVKIESQGEVTKVATSLPDSMQQKIEQVPPLVMMMAMTGGLGGPGGNPFAGPPKSLGNSGEPPAFVFDGMSPGQTAPIEASSVDGLPEGTTLTAMTAWSVYPSSDPALKGLYPMEIILDLKGDYLREICGYGQVSLKSVTLAEGGTMKVSKTQSLMYSNAVKVLIPYDTEARTLDSPPDGTIRIHVLVDQPADSAKQIATLEGTCKLLTSEGMEEFKIEEAPKVAKRPLTDPVLKAAGVKLLKTNDLKGEALTMSCAKGFSIGILEAVDEESDDPAGNTASSHTEIEKNQLVQKVVWQDPSKNNKLPAKLSLKGRIYKGVNEKMISFKFENIALPKREARPGQVQGNMPQQPTGMP